MPNRRWSWSVLAALVVLPALPAQRPTTWRCAHVLAEDGRSWRDDMVITTLGGEILRVDAGRAGVPADVDLGDGWAIPGLIDLHTHLFLQPYNVKSWDDQVRGESNELRALRAAVHARDTLLAGFTVVRDLGTEGADYGDVALQQALGQGLCRGPQVLVATRAIVLTGCYGPDPEDPKARKGAQCVAGEDAIRQAVRAQVAGGAQWIKVYADYRHGKAGPVAPTFTLEELQALCDEARKAQRPVAAHANTDEGIRRAVLAGVATIEHGAGASPATLQLMQDKGVVLCPCLAANEAIVRHAGHTGPLVERLNLARIGFQRALAAGVAIACGSDAGVFRHGDNARELELMVAYGMKPEQALAAATTVAAQVLGRADLGALRAGSRGGFVVLGADPLRDIQALRQVRAVVRERDERAR